jgi:thiamine biosynthesis protein ThiS
MPQIHVNGMPRALADGATVADLVRTMELQGKRVAVEVNGEVVPKSRWDSVPLAERDRVEIVGAVGGG